MLLSLFKKYIKIILQLNVIGMLITNTVTRCNFFTFKPEQQKIQKH